jgi:hypothetical protein
MTQQRSQLLEQAIAELSSLPLEEQDRFAAEILAELAGEAEWDRLFASDASQSWLAAQAQKVRKDEKEGKLIALDCDLDKA